MGSILNRNSLAKTLWSLELARLEGRKASDTSVQQALAWVASRQGQSGSYAQRLFAPTTEDLKTRNGTPTFEDNGMSNVGTMHILGEEAARALELWKFKAGWDRDRVRHVLTLFRRKGAKFCCYRCSIAWWRAISAARIPDWEDTLAKAVKWVEDSMPAGTSRPGHFPYYYLLLALSEMPIPEVERVRKRLRPSAERSLKNLNGNDVRAVFRRHAAEWAAK